MFVSGEPDEANLTVALRAVEVARVARAPRSETVPVLGLAVPMSVGAWAFVLVTALTAVMLARAAWAREP